MHIVPVETHRERYRDLLLLADEQWDMVERYLYRGDMFVLTEGGTGDANVDGFQPAPVFGCMVVTDEGVDTDGARVVEIKNLVVAPEAQRNGYGRMLIEFAARCYATTNDVLQVGTGDSPLTLPFYEACGFVRSHVAPGFFLEHYDHPIIEEGVQLVDMVYLRREL